MLHKSQPLNESKELLEKLGIKEETEEERIAGRKVLKEEIVDSMFGDWDLDCKPTLWDKIRWFFPRLNEHFRNKRWGIKNYFKLRKQLEEYRPWDIRAFLPFFVKHLEVYIDIEKKYGYATQKCKDYKISTAQEAVDILKRILDEEYVTPYRDEVEKKWGKFPYKKTTYVASVGYEHLTPKGYDEEISAAYKKAMEDEQNDLKRLGEIIQKDMLAWWD